MYITPMLWVGTGPAEPYQPTPGIKGVRHAKTAPEAALLIKQKWAVIVATTDIAYQTLRLIGSDHQWASYVTSGVEPGYAAEMFGGINA